MKLRTEKILPLLIEKSSIIIFFISVLLLSILGYLYCKYLYTALTFEPEMEDVEIENQIDEETLQAVIQNIDDRKQKYLKSITKGYKDPFR